VIIKLITAGKKRHETEEEGGKEVEWLSGTKTRNKTREMSENKELSVVEYQMGCSGADPASNLTVSLH
jgi:hypothetical protein